MQKGLVDDAKKDICLFGTFKFKLVFKIEVLT